MSKNKLEDIILQKNFPRKILGLDVSTACIGVSLVVDYGYGTPEILKLTHLVPKITGKQAKKIKGIEALFIRKNIFENEFLVTLKDTGITDVIIEEPLLSSNNVYTVDTLSKFNGMISEAVYRVLGIVPNFISSYDSRMYSFPELLSIRKFNKKGEPYPISHIKKSIKDNHLTLFGSYPYDVDKKVVMMNLVNSLYPEIPWIYNKKGELKKENFDACDSLVCALAYINLNRNGLMNPEIENTIITQDTKTVFNVEYKVKVWDRYYEKKINIE